MSQWEYRIKSLFLEPTKEFGSFEAQLQSHLNLLGRDGWEVFHVVANEQIPNHYKVWAKRRAEV